MGDKDKQWLEENFKKGVEKLKQAGQYLADGAKANMQRDLEILEYYANKGDRVHYWNYLAKMPGNDGYGLLALGVVQNDNLPGRTANLHAAKVAFEHGVPMTPGKWEEVGKELLLQDIKHRKAEFAAGRYENVVNLPGVLVEKAHDDMFAKFGLPPETWTAKKFMQAAREPDNQLLKELYANLGLPNNNASKLWNRLTHRSGGEAGANALWSQVMLNNKGLGISRADSTTKEAASLKHLLDTANSWGYAIAGLSMKDPNQCGPYYYNQDKHKWYIINEGTHRGATWDPQTQKWSFGQVREDTEVKDPAKIQYLNERREIIIEHQNMKPHPQDKDGSKVLEPPFSIENQTLPRSSEYAAPEAQPGLANSAPSENAQLGTRASPAGANDAAKEVASNAVKDPFGARVDAILEAQTAQNDPHAVLRAVAQASQERQAGQIQGLDPIAPTQGQVLSRS